MNPDRLFDNAYASQLLEQQRAETRKRLRANPSFQVSIRSTGLSSLLGVGHSTFVRDFRAVELPKDPTQSGKYILTGQEFMNLEQMRDQIRAERRNHR